jgi:Ca2+-binding RTX toxin-like protein
MSTASSIERYMLDLLNAERMKADLPGLIFERRLNDAAEEYSEHLLEHDRFSHTGADGSTLEERLREAAFDLAGSYAAGENLVASPVGPGSSLRDEVRAMHETLMASPTHRANILSDEFGYIGIGLERGEFRGVQYLMGTQNFGRTEGDVHLEGDDGRDVIRSGPGDDRLIGHRGNDLLNGREGDDHISAGSGGDLLFGKDGDDTLDGGSGSDQISGARGNDRLFGKEGRDTLEGGWGDDYISGHMDDDRMNGSTGNDTINAGSGDDTLLGSWGKDMLYGKAGHDLINGGQGDDLLSGLSGNDLLLGKEGDDNIRGGSGSDTLSGASGADTLDGGGDNDRLRGGGGEDVFVFDGNDGRDLVQDFENGVDLIRIEGGFDFSDLRIRDTGPDVRIEFGDTRITLEDTFFSAIGASDFVFG